MPARLSATRNVRDSLADTFRVLLPFLRRVVTHGLIEAVVHTSIAPSTKLTAPPLVASPTRRPIEKSGRSAQPQLRILDITKGRAHDRNAAFWQRTNCGPLPHAIIAERGSAKERVAGEKVISEGLAVAARHVARRGIETTISSRNSLEVQPSGTSAFGRFAQLVAKLANVPVEVEPTIVGKAIQSFFDGRRLVPSICSLLRDQLDVPEVHELGHALFAARRKSHGSGGHLNGDVCIAPRVRNRTHGYASQSAKLAFRREEQFLHGLGYIEVLKALPDLRSTLDDLGSSSTQAETRRRLTNELETLRDFYEAHPVASFAAASCDAAKIAGTALAKANVREPDESSAIALSVDTPNNDVWLITFGDVSRGSAGWFLDVTLVGARSTIGVTIPRNDPASPKPVGLVQRILHALKTTESLSQAQLDAHGSVLRELDAMLGALAEKPSEPIAQSTIEDIDERLHRLVEHAYDVCFSVIEPEIMPDAYFDLAESVLKMPWRPGTTTRRSGCLL